MSDFWWPKTIRPLGGGKFSFTRGGNIANQKINGGLPISRRDTAFDAVPFSLTFSLTADENALIWSFIDGKINGGASSFKMLLDSGAGLREHQVKIDGEITSTYKTVNRFYMSFSVIAEKTSTQNEDASALFDVVERYGDDLTLILPMFKRIVDALPAG